ncbi:acylphosphatase [Sulfuricella sp. T08]|uniref:acylphosphatase n=1 Tax=Sulfuricella sp. T08 TaxID=1632857 RepID=UPI0006179FA5|nr:acylphosphatase [Sulfuricella sp. T08]GAO35657.1 acylphosphatase [Sulfuricella sp. T08]
MNNSHHLRIYGRVQGVFFRESMCRKAQQLGVTGWVRNCRDGTVEAMIQGAEEAISAMIEWARTGPELARVEEVEISAGSGEYADFEKRDTA